MIPCTTPLWLSLAEQGLLVLILSAAVLRVTFVETPHVEPLGQTSPLSNEAISLVLSSLLLAAAAAWVMLSALAGRLRWRNTRFAGAVGAFCVVGLVSAASASDKRAALTDLAVLLSGPAAGLLAVQLFDRKEKVRLFLWLLLAVGAATTYACYDKKTSSNDMLIAEFEKNPDVHLRRFGIEPGSLEHWQYKHRLYSRDVSGFLTTSNSTGSFFLLAVFAGLGLCIEAFRAGGINKSAGTAHPTASFFGSMNEETLVAAICVGLATALSLGGLWMTQSKGALGALVIFVPILAACVLFRKTLWTHRRGVCAASAALTLAAVAAMVIYGTRHGRLPGGNSMLVRWQYWAASTEIAKEHPFLGVGGGNFVAPYMAHKNPAAPETISDPHNWVFSILCRFGLAGLFTLGLAMLRPITKLFMAATRATEQRGGHGPRYNERYFWTALLAGVMAAMLVVRPGLFRMDGPEGSAMEQSAAFFLLIVIPAGILALVFGLLRFAAAGDASLNRPNTALSAAIGCGLGAVLLHNLVDFALFEPGVWTLFWLLAAAGLAEVHNQEPDGGFKAIPLQPSTWQLTALGLPPAVFGLIAALVVIPPLRRGDLVYQAIRSATPASAVERFEQAVAADTLSPDAAITAARVLLSNRAALADPALLRNARTFVETAIARSPADPRPRRLLGDILLATAERNDDIAEKKTLQDEAYRALQGAVRLYPGSDALNYRLGVLADDLNRPDEAVAYLEAALDIEIRYREQFRVMYPTQEEVISRLGPTVYADLLARLARLREEKTTSEVFGPVLLSL